MVYVIGHSGTNSAAPVRLPRALLLDLDGTLIDSAPDIAAALGEVLATRGIDPIPVAHVRRLIGHGIGSLVREAFALSGAPVADEVLPDAQQEMAKRYAAQLVARTVLLPGAADLIARCSRAGIRLACVTNKPRQMAESILGHFRLAPPIAVIIGGDMGIARKPAPEPLLVALDRLGVARGEAWMVGDGIPDHRAARAAGIPSIAVASDYGEPFDGAAEATISLGTLGEVIDLLDDLGACAGARK